MPKGVYRRKPRAPKVYPSELVSSVQRLRASTDFYTNNVNRRGRAGKRFKGIWWSKTRRKWQTVMRLNGKAVGWGYYDTEEEAARAYDRMTREHLGTVGRYNFPRDGEQSAAAQPVRTQRR